MRQLWNGSRRARKPGSAVEFVPWKRRGRLLGLGAEKVIIGTAAFRSDGPDDTFLRELIATVPREAILLALDSKSGRIVVKGWRESLDLSAVELIRALEPYCGGFLCTYVDKEG
jgi:phosphoribosylformimino-5-aminoimidazole carboxamide ribonucleotide (ProFAR) isomerase